MQGKSNKQYEDSARFAWYGVVGMVIILILVSLLTGCSTTNKTPKKCCDKEHVITEWDGGRQINWYTCKNESYGSKGTNQTTIKRKSKK